ncbi:MAG: hypothetical protein QNK05_19325, partial [Myxococcota bacterium]|nr:hypothetical protein [Myxococcota bacterium]
SETLTVADGLVLGGTIRLASTNSGTSAARLAFQGSQAVDGGGVIAFSSGAAFEADENFVVPTGGGTTAFGAGITISGGSGTFGGPDGTFAFEGTFTPANSGRVEIAGVIENFGAALSIEPGPGSFVLDGGAIRNALILGPGTLIADQGAGELQSIQLDANLRLGLGGTVTVTGGLILNGTITLASTNSGAGAARLLFSEDQLVDGPGVIAFSSGSAFESDENFVEPVGGATVTFGPGLTVEGGSGTLGGAEGTVSFLGTLDPSAPGVVRVLGEVSNAGAPMTFLDGPGRFSLAGALLRNATINGPIELVNSETLTVVDGLTLNGIITLASTNSGASAARLEFQGDQAVDGNGVIAFASGSAFASNENFVVPVGGGTTVFGAGITIRGGSGTFGGPEGTFGFEGTFDPNQDGRVDIAGLIDNAGGSLVVLAGPGSFALNGGTLSDTAVEGEGTLEAVGTLGVVDSVRLDANLLLGTSDRVTVIGGLTLNGTITLASTNSGASAGRLEFEGDQGVDGNGTIAFSSGSAFQTDENFVVPTGGGTTLFGSGIMIVGGSGTFGGPDGTVSFEGTLNPLNAGRVEIAGVIENVGAAFAIEDGPGAFVLDGGAIRNALILGSGTLVVDQGASQLEASQLDADLRLGLAGIVTVTGGLALNGTITLASTNAGAGAAQLLFAGDQLIGGSGVIVFSSGSAFQSDENFVAPVGGATVTFGPQTTVEGGSGTLGGAGTVVLQGGFTQGTIVFGGPVILP